MNINLIMYTKGFEVVFSVNGSLIDDKNVHKGLKIKIFLTTSLFCVKVISKFGFLSVIKKMIISRLKRVMALILELNIRM